MRFRLNENPLNICIKEIFILHFMLHDMILISLLSPLPESGQVGDVAALTATTEDLKHMLSEVEEALKEREGEVELRREKNDEYNTLKKEVDEQLNKIESGMEWSLPYGHGSKTLKLMSDLNYTIPNRWRLSSVTTNNGRMFFMRKIY